MKMLLYILLSFMFAHERGWTHPETGWEMKTGSHMCVFSLNDVFIDNIHANINQTDAIGVFYENQCIGWAYYTSNLTLIAAIGNDGGHPEYPSNDDEINFYIYDDSESEILELQSVINLPLWTNGGWNSTSSLYACRYNAPIDSGGICPQNCEVDINQDQNIDILDIILLVDITISLVDPEILCGDIIDDDEVNILDILTLVEIVMYEL